MAAVAKKQAATTERAAPVPRDELVAKFGDWLDPEVGRRYLVWTVTHAFDGLLVGRTTDYLVLGEVVQVFETGDRTDAKGSTYTRSEKLYGRHLHRIPHGAIIDVSDVD